MKVSNVVFQHLGREPRVVVATGSYRFTLNGMFAAVTHLEAKGYRPPEQLIEELIAILRIEYLEDPSDDDDDHQHEGDDQITVINLRDHESDPDPDEVLPWPTNVELGDN